MRPTEMVEIGAVMRFLDFYKVPYSKDQIKLGAQDDSVDVYVESKNLKFQVTTVKGEMIRLIKDKIYSDGTNADQAINKYIINPISKKYLKYMGQSVDDVTLLIHCIILPSLNWLESSDKQEKDSIENTYQKSGFKDIYLIEEISNKVFCLFPKKIRNK